MLEIWPKYVIICNHKDVPSERDTSCSWE